MPARQGWYLEDVIRAPDAPVGTNDLLVVEALNLLKLSGARLATLGTSPLAKEGVISSRIDNQELTGVLIRGAFRCFAPFYNFDGLRRFKAKFAPTWWESEYLLFPRQLTAPPYILKAFIQAIAPRDASKQLIREVTGKLSLPSFRRKVRTSARELELVRTDLGMNEDGFKSYPDKLGQLPGSPSGNHYLSQFVTVAGLRLHYVSKGCGQPVVFIHGNPGSYHDSMAVFQDMSETHRTVVFDRPGHGYSERGDGKSMTVEGQARLLLKALQQLNVESPVVVGHSWGGSVALAMSLLPEANLSGLVLLAPAAYPSGSSEWWAYLVEAPLIGRYLVKVLTPLIGKRIVRDSLREAYYPNEIQQEYLESVAQLWLSEDRIKALVEDDKSLNASLELMSQSYSELHLPVIIVTGSSDQVVKPQEHAERLHAAIPGSRLITLPDTGHQIPQLRPEAVREAIESVYSQAEPAGTLTAEITGDVFLSSCNLNQ
jgi:pimeloyl-ACP methyl ester carboxylesterase